MTAEPLTDHRPGPRAWFGRVRRLSERTPLRVKLVLSVLLLSAVGLAGAGFAAAHYLRDYMVKRVDQQLQPPRFLGPGGNTNGAPIGDAKLSSVPTVLRGACSNSDPLRIHSTGTRFVRCTSLGGQTIGGDGAPAGSPVPALPRWTVTQAQAQGARLFTVGSQGSGPDWRVRTAVVGNVILYEANSLGDVDSTVSRLEVDELVIGLSVLVLIGGLGYWMVRRSLRPLGDVEHTAAAIADGDLSRRVPHRDPRTEVGRLALAVNGMLGQIETSFRIRRASEEAALASEQRMRRFVTDASHELRTPLTSIRGFAELYRQGAAGQPEDVARLMRRIEDEATRMGVLVDDLLLLARLDQQRPLEREIVDLVVLASDAVHDAAAVAPERGIGLAMLDGPPPPEIVGDEARLRQVIGNLVTNALTHTPPGTPVSVRIGSRVLDGQLFAVVEVADEGPGLSPEAAARVFERFYRADASRTRSSGGSGLGLSIVAGLVAAHAGRVEVDSAPGRGATFRVLLPAVPDDDPAPQPVQALPATDEFDVTPASAGESTSLTS